MPDRRRPGIVLALTAVLLPGCAVAEAPPSATVPAATVVSPVSDVSQTYVAEPGPTGRVTFGFLVCTQGSGGARVTAVEPKEEIGSGFSVEGVRLVTFAKGEGITLATPGYPPRPRPSDAVQAVKGAVPVACTDPDRLSEIQVGLSTTGPDGGGWGGAVVTFDDGEGRTGSIDIPFRMYLCGTSTDPC